MDEIVARAIAKWPNVPSVYGWLSLDRRGNWSIKGERIRNPLIAEFIARNYAHDERGRWFFQNGPQRVFVRLACTPLVYRTRTADTLAFLSHTGQEAQRVAHAWVEDEGQLIIQTELGVGMLHDQDLARVLAHLTDSDGSPLADAAVEQLLDAAANAATPAPAYLDAGVHTGACLDAGAYLNTKVYLDTMGGGRVQVGVIRGATLAEWFGFDPDPHPAPGEPEC